MLKAKNAKDNNKSRAKTTFIRPKSRKNTSKSRFEKTPLLDTTVYQNMIDQSQNIGHFPSSNKMAKTHQTCQSTLSNYNKLGDNNQMNPHASIQT